MASGSRELLTYGEPCLQGEPLRVVAHLAEGIVLRRPLMLDALLAWSVSVEHRLLAPAPGEESHRIEIPIRRSECGRYHLVTQGMHDVEASELRYKNRRAPHHEMARLGSAKIRRVDIAAGVNKGFRIPYSLELLTGDQIAWWCIGDRERISGLLSRVHYLGKHRGSGKGRLDIHGTPWTVEPCETWPGFPVLKGGLPLRQLPLDAPGLAPGHRQSFAVLTFPYYDQTKEELCAVP